MSRGLRQDVTALTAALLACGVAARPAVAQDAPPPGLTMDFTVPVFGQHVFASDLDGGGEVAISRVGARLGTDLVIDRDLKLNLRATYELSLYDFSGLSDLGDPDPWEDIHTLTLSPQLQWSITSDWTLFGGPIFRFARESGANFSQGFDAGGIFGATHVIHRGLVIGGGLGVISQTEDDAQVFPVIILNWAITEELRLTGTSGPANLTTAGLELVYDPPGAWSFGLGGRYENRRFRLNDNGFAPGGVGEETSIPIWLRASYEVSDSVSLHLYGGAQFFGELEIDDDDGVGLGEADLDPAPTLAFMATFTF